MGKNNKIPDRWSDYLPVGQVILGTKVIACKVPLKTNLCQQHLSEDEWFTPAMLLERQPQIRTVIDLTNTFRYYNGEEEFGTKGIDYVKILVQGRGTIPTVLQLQKFFDAMDHHIEKYKDNADALIGVHCTHGLNRTGYFICRWMVERLGIRPDDAIERFNLARGHNIERQHLLDDLRRANLPSVPCVIPRIPPPSGTNDYRSPLLDYYDEPSHPQGSRYGRYRGTGPNSHQRMASGRNNSESYRSDRHIGNHHHRRNYQNASTWRRPGHGEPSRADLDTNWRTRDKNDSNNESRNRHSRNFGGWDSRASRRSRNNDGNGNV